MEKNEHQIEEMLTKLGQHAINTTKTYDSKEIIKQFSNKYNKNLYDEFDKLNEDSFNLLSSIGDKNEIYESIINWTNEKIKHLEKLFLDIKEIEKTNTKCLETLGHLLISINLRNWALNKHQEMLNNITSNNLDNTKIIPLQKVNIMNSKLANKLTDKDLINGLSLPIDKNKNILTIAQIQYEEDSLQFNKEINLFDKLVYDVVISFFISGQKILTPNIILRAIKGNSKNTNFTNQQIKKIQNSIEKLRSTRIIIDYTNEAKLRKLKGENFTINNYLLNITEAKQKIHGNIIDNAYKIESEPTLYTYTKTTKQINTVPIDILKPIKTGFEEMGYYLIQRIEQIKYNESKKNKTKNNTIIIKELFKKHNLKYADRTQRKRVIDKIKTLLNDWVKIKYISKFEFIKENRTYSKIKILI